MQKYRLVSKFVTRHLGQLFAVYGQPGRTGQVEGFHITDTGRVTESHSRTLTVLRTTAMHNPLPRGN
jgi:hypothetical protein